MVEVWARDLFNRPVMIEWNTRPTDKKTYVDVVIYFTKQLRAIEQCFGGIEMTGF